MPIKTYGFVSIEHREDGKATFLSKQKIDLETGAGTYILFVCQEDLEVGKKVTKEMHNASSIAAQIVFYNPASIDLWIKHLKILKKAMINKKF